MEPDRLTVLMDGKEQRSVSFNPAEFRQFDHGYAVTSHSSQGLTADRVIANSGDRQYRYRLQPQPHQQQTGLCRHLPRLRRREDLHERRCKPLKTITVKQITDYRTWRAAQSVGPATLNAELGILRRMLKRAKLWARVADDIKPLKETATIGRALRLRKTCSGCSERL
jgi:hypothetical protein